MASDADQQRPGVVCESFTPRPLSLAHGNQLLLARDPAYPDNHRYRARAHTIEAVFDVVDLLDLPDARWCQALPEGLSSSAGIYAGYLLLDAWIANQDRHHENWGAIWDGQRLQLAPTFDHGASLARNLSDEQRYERLNSPDRNRQIPVFARRARSALYADAAARRPLSTLEAWRAFGARVPADAGRWGARLAEVDPAAVASIFDRMRPDRISSIGRQFTVDLLAENRRRLLEPLGQ